MLGGGPCELSIVKPSTYKQYNTILLPCLIILNLFQENNLWQPKKLSTSRKYNVLKYFRYAMELVKSECSSKLRGSQQMP